MSKYIKLEDAEDKMYQLWEEDTDSKINSAYRSDDDSAIEALRSLPTIDIVRCEECENFNPMTHGCKRSPSVEPWWEDDFCSYGEREDYE